VPFTYTLRSFYFTTFTLPKSYHPRLSSAYTGPASWRSGLPYICNMSAQTREGDYSSSSEAGPSRYRTTASPNNYSLHPCVSSAAYDNAPLTHCSARGPRNTLHSSISSTQKHGHSTAYTPQSTTFGSPRRRALGLNELTMAAQQESSERTHQHTRINSISDEYDLGA
jgi:hypothetical protein